MRKIIVILAATMLSLLLVASVSAETKISFSVWQQPNHYMVKTMQRWAKEVETRTHGKIKIVFYYGGTLTKGSQCYDGIINGISDAGAACSGWSHGRFPLTRITDLPLGWTSSTQASLVSWDFYKKFKPKEWNQTHLLYLFTDGIGYLHSKSPIRSLHDLVGMQVRGTGSDVPIIKALGGTPVAMPWSEVYLALQRGIASAMISNYASFKAAKLAEVTGYTTEHNIRSAGFWVAMNLAKWNSLSPGIQKIIDKASEEAVLFTGKALDAAQQAGRDYTLKSGNKIITLTSAEGAKFDKRLKPLVGDWVKAMESKGLQGKEALDFVLRDMQKYKNE